MATKCLSSSRSGFRLTNDLALIFHNLQASLQDTKLLTRRKSDRGSVLYPDELVAISEEYRGCLRLAILTLDDTEGQEEEDESPALRQFYVDCEQLWSCVEMCFFKSSDSILAADLCAWAANYHNSCDSWLSDMVEECSEGGSTGFMQNHKAYWPVVSLYVCFGRFAAAVELLSLHTSAGKPQIAQLIVSLQEAPLGAMIGDDNGMTDLCQWQEWQAECGEFVAAGRFVDAPEIEAIFKVISGNAEALVAMGASGSLQNWYEALVPLVLYRHQSTTIATLHQLSTETMRIVPPSTTHSGSRMSPFNNAMQSIVNLDILTALNDIQKCSYNGNRLLVCHLADMFSIAGDSDMSSKSSLKPFKLDTSLTIKGNTVTHVYVNVRDSLLLHYAKELTADATTLHVGLRYLAQCSDATAGRNVIEDCIRTHVNKVSARLSDGDWLRIERACITNTLTSVWRDLCDGKCAEHSHNRQFTLSLTWAIRSQDIALMSRVAKECAEHGASDVMQMHMLDCIDDISHNTPTLLFLCHYRKAQQQMAADHMTDALDSLCTLLDSKLTPNALKMNLVKQVSETAAKLERLWESEEGDEGMDVNDGPPNALKQPNNANTISRVTLQRLQSLLTTITFDIETMHLHESYGEPAATIVSTLAECQKKVETMHVLRTIHSTNAF